MPTGQANKLTGAVGEFLVAAELCRRELLATPFAGNVPHYDIIATGPKGGHVAVQVKAINGKQWQFNVSKFVDVAMHEDGRRQVLGKPKPEPFPGIMVVLVALQRPGADRFFILEWGELRDLLKRGYQEYLVKHSYIRPKAPGSFHMVLSTEQVAPFEGKWDKILDQVGVQAAE